MRRLEVGELAGRVTFITGPGRASGKTSLLNAALGLLRRAGEKPAFLGIGFDGEMKFRSSVEGGTRDGSGFPGLRGATRIVAEAGELFVTASACLAASAVRPEVLALLPGSGALGPLALVRAWRRGEVVLVGAEANDVVLEAVRLAREEFGHRSLLIDGAFDRITQVAVVPGARFLSSLRVDAAGLSQVVRRMRLLARLSRLPLHEDGRREGGLSPQAKGSIEGGRKGEGASSGGTAEGTGTGTGNGRLLPIRGPLTSSVLASLPPEAEVVVVDDLTKVFLEESELDSLERRHVLRVRQRIDFGGFVIVLHGMERQRLLDALGPGFPEALLVANPYELGSGHDAA
jgi:hypothetical protein